MTSISPGAGIIEELVVAAADSIPEERKMGCGEPSGEHLRFACPLLPSFT